MMSRSTRRRFFGNVAAGSAVMTFGSVVPEFLQQAAAASTQEDRIIVVIEMAGGNDGLNTIVPYDHDVYKKARPKLAIARNYVIPIEEGIGLHASMRGFADLLEEGSFAVVQGVGYPNPNQSHFESMDIWHSCLRKDQTRVDGWLGRFLETTKRGDSSDPAGLHLGADKQPFALMSREVRVASIQSLDQFRLDGIEQPQFRAAVQALADVQRGGDNDLLGFVQTSTTSALAASQRIESAGVQYQPTSPYPDSELANKLHTVAKLIASGLKTTIYYAQIDGFDTHANQLAAHAALLKQTSDAVSHFMKDMTGHGLSDRILVMCFSEFGRRVAENASQGTDHGTAGPILLAGTRVHSGLIGKQPSLTELQNGDLKFHTDFRQVYASVIQTWLKCPSSEILKGEFSPIAIFRSDVE